MTKQENKIAAITGLELCNEDCGCGENSGLWFTPSPRGGAEWLPSWMNGVDTQEVWRWLKETKRV